MKVIKVKISPRIESQIEKNKIKIKNKSNKKIWVRVLSKVQKITKDKYTISIKKKPSIKLVEKATPSQLKINKNKLNKNKL